MRLTASIGETFGLLKVASEPFLYKGNTCVLCDCSCGVKGKRVRLTALHAKHTKSCGCLREKWVSRELKYPVSLGDKFGDLKVTKVYIYTHIKADGSPQKRVLCDCDCSCGGIKKGIYVYNLIKKYTTSCGCRRAKTITKRSQYQPDSKVGIFTLISKAENPDSLKGVFWKVRCSCNNERVLSLTTIKESTHCTCPTDVPQSRYVDKELYGWKVLRVYYKDSKDKNQLAESRCLSCGNSKPIRLSSLVAGKAARCSCRRLTHSK